MTSDAEAIVIRQLFLRYERLIFDNPDKLSGLPNKCGQKHMARLCNEVMTNAETYPYDKLCRWLGFIQGVLAVQGIIDVDVERDYTRPLFHGLTDEVIPTF